MMTAVAPDLPSGTVSFLFTDVEGSTRLLHELGAAGYAEALAEHRRVLRGAFSEHGGVEVDTQGDAFFVAFPTAPGALDAAAEALERLAPGPIRVRMGIHTGTPHLAEEGYVGVDVHRAARIAACGHAGQVLVSASPAALVGTERLHDLGEHRLKDLSAPERIYQFGEDEFPRLNTLHQTNLPFPSTPFLGRGRELTEVIGLLSRDDVRLLTLTGPGGTGKTRLGLQAAAELGAGYSYGVWWVPLAALSDPELVLATAAQALGARDGLVDHVADRSMLLLLDNFEHLVDAAADLASLLASCPKLDLLVTSREALHLSGEREYAVPSFVEEEAVELFRQRAVSAEPEETVRAICLRLDCLPLAIELAAARTKVLSPGQVLERLEQRFPLLTGGPRDAPERQKTLRATIEWSYDLLSAEEQRVFAQLAAFAGGCTLDAAEAVTDADLDTLQSLVDKSLVRYTEERFWMLETIREYANERLEQTAYVEEVRARHSHFFNRLALAAGTAIVGPRTSESLDVLEREHPNIRIALAWARDNGEQDDALATIAGIWRFWELRGHLLEGMRWFDEMLDAAETPDSVRLEALRGGAALAQQVGELSRAKEFADEMLALARGAGDVHMTGIAVAILGTVAIHLGDFERAISRLEEAREMLRQAGDDLALGRVMNSLGYAALAMRDFPRATKYSREGFEVASRVGDDAGRSVSLANLGCGQLLAGSDADAEASFVECLTLSREVGFSGGVAYSYEGLAGLAIHRGNAARAARLLGAAEILLETIGAQLDFVERTVHDDVVGQLEGLLSPDKLAAEWAAGREMAPMEAFAYALSVG
jgi:predicted ATPase/class 3 adenylate cyclase